MISAQYKDKSLIIDILRRSFQHNKSVNYIIRQDKFKLKRLENLLAYSFDICYTFGEVYLSEDKKGCALLTLPHKKKTSLKSIFWDVQLAFSTIGIGNIKKAWKREALIKQKHPSKPIFYLWFIGVDPDQQSQGIGSKLLQDIIYRSKLEDRPIYLETSTMKNLPWYKKFGFQVFDELDLGYTLYFLRRE